MLKEVGFPSCFVPRVGAPSRRRALASDTLLNKLEKRLNRRLRPLPVGRPKKVKRRMKTMNR